MKIARRLLLPVLAASVVGAAEDEDQIPRKPLGEEPHAYWDIESKDAFARIADQIRSGDLELDQSTEQGRLLDLLRVLDIPVESQLLVYSATSLQSGLIQPSNPRALYFNEEVYVGYVPNGKLEIAAIDPTLGPVFHIYEPNNRGTPPLIARTERCMNCHAGTATDQVPGLVAESVIVMQRSGASLKGYRRDQTGHQIPIEDRLGGWHVTGAHANGNHLGNLLGTSAAQGDRKLKNPPGNLFAWDRYPRQTSDLLTHLIHEHQLGFHNRVTSAVYRTREALDAGNGRLSTEHAAELNEHARELIRYLLFADEADLPRGGVKGDKDFMEVFLGRRKASSNGASLRDFNLRSRLFKYRCSYMIHTPGFLQMPREFLERVWAGLDTVLKEEGGPREFSYLPATEKRAIRHILRETIEGLPAGF
jgi:hypothetical protein